MRLCTGITVICLLAACSKDKTIATPTSNNGNGSGQNTQVLSTGNFTPTSGISVSGSAKVITTAAGMEVLLDSFMVSPGPDLKVYLSQQSTPAGFVNLGALKSNSGNSSYAVPPGVNVQQYTYVLIHCQQYNHLFAIAQLK